MKILFAFAIVCTSALSSVCAAQSVFKCTVNGAVTFQQEPCAAPAPPAAHAAPLPADSPLIGSWLSDHDVTMAWLRKHTTMTKKKDAFLDQLIGHMRLTFTRDHVKTDMPDISVQLDGKPAPMKGWHSVDPFTVVSVSANHVTLSGANPVTGATELSEHDFEGHDTMWEPVAMDPGSREYFRRVK
jgi:hypothetical protein